jgi:RNA polymerase sigma-70 factor (ECF subfamily)
MSREQQEFEELLGRIREAAEGSTAPSRGPGADTGALMGRIRKRSEGSARWLLERIGPHLRTVIRQKLPENLRSVFDTIDFLQDVWASFFAGELDQSFHDPNALITYLVRMARNKVADEVRRRLSGGKSDLSREHSLDGSAQFEAAGLADDTPPPGELAASSEEWDRLVRGRPWHHVRILEMLRQGHTHAEIAAKLGFNEKTVRRLIQKIASRGRP